MKLFLGISLLALAVSPPILCSSVEILHGTTRVKVIQGDITQQQVEVIVNAANAELKGGAGVCGAIFAAAGRDQLQKACDLYPAKNGVRCPTGQAKITQSFNLKKNGVRHIIHAVGPDCRIIKDPVQRKKLLTDAYENSLQLAAGTGCKSIAFPFISSAIYAYPKELAAQIAIETVKHFALSHKSSLEEISFVLFSQEDFDLFKKTLQPLNSAAVQSTNTWFEKFKTQWQRFMSLFFSKKEETSAQ